MAKKMEVWQGSTLVFTSANLKALLQDDVIDKVKRRPAAFYRGKKPDQQTVTAALWLWLGMTKPDDAEEFLETWFARLDRFEQRAKAALRKKTVFLRPKKLRLRGWAASVNLRPPERRPD